MYIDIVPNRNSPPAILLRESVRKGAQIQKRTLANMSTLTPQQVEALRRVLKGEKLVPFQEKIEILASAPHGHIEALRMAIERLRFDQLVASRPCRERAIVVAMIAARILEPDSEIPPARRWHATTLPEIFGVSDVGEGDLGGALDWLLQSQDRIEKKLAARHLKEGGAAICRLSSSGFEGFTRAPSSLLTDDRGRPVAIAVLAGGVGAPRTLTSWIKKIKTRLDIKTMMLVGERGMISQKQIEEIQDIGEIGWVTPLRIGAIRKLVDDGTLQSRRFKERGCLEFTHPDFPNERLVACRDEGQRRLLARKRRSSLEATRRQLAKIQAMAARGAIEGKDKIGLRVGAILNAHKMAKYFILDIKERSLSFRIDHSNAAEETALDGVLILRSSLPKERFSSENIVRSYKTLEFKTRPSRRRLAERSRAHAFLGLLANYVEWHMREAWRSELPSDKALAGGEVCSFQVRLKLLSSIVRNRCRAPSGGPNAPTFDMVTTPTSDQQRAFNLLKAIGV